MENTTLHSAELIDLKNQMAKKDQRIQFLEEMVKALRYKQFGRSSEKLSVDQINLFNEAEDEPSEK